LTWSLPTHHNSIGNPSNAIASVVTLKHVAIRKVAKSVQRYEQTDICDTVGEADHWTPTRTTSTLFQIESRRTEDFLGQKGVAMAETGVVVFYDEKDNYGFIEPDDESGDLTFTLFPGEGPVTVGDSVIFERMPTPYITPIGATAYRVRRAGFAPMQPRVEPEPVPEEKSVVQGA
jgi:hypothetical protein